MQQKRVQELREMARKHGVKGYSRMRKDELIQTLEQIQLDNGPIQTSPPADAVATTEPSTQLDQEQRIEQAKYHLGTVDEQPMVDDLGEDIDHLPPLRIPSLSLLPQQPGILQAYWHLQAGHLQQQPGLRLRLCYLAQQTLHTLDELALSEEQGHWYFHIDPALEAAEVYVQLGHYGADGEFHSAMEHAAVRLPRLTASRRHDSRWWLSEIDFRHLYLRSGGRLLASGELGWLGGGPSSVTSSWSLSSRGNW